MDFLQSLPTKITAEFDAILDAVAKAPPPAFSGAENGRPCMGTWRGSTKRASPRVAPNHRLFCLLVRASDQLAGPSIVCLGGLTRPPRSAAHPRDYARIKQYADEFRKHGKVLE
jgi:hypothetical protein